MALEAASAENLSSGLDADLSGFLGAVFVIWMATPDLFACERASTRVQKIYAWARAVVGVAASRPSDYQ